MLGQLVPIGGGDPIPLMKPRLLIGRRETCDISLRFPNVSSHHCELELVNGYWRVRDLNSRNGIKVNDSRIDSSWVLPGDTLSVAKHVYEVQYDPGTEAPPPEALDVFSMSLLEKAGLTRRDEDYHARQHQQEQKRVRELLPEDDLPDWFTDSGPRVKE
ncbi:MAG: FHA domain-containing protein [Planctomycetaceae bacterium]|nr:FHA domain-containing protein [Planctomycetaceae bacterium]